MSRIFEEIMEGFDALERSRMILGVMGNAGTGKDTFANHLVLHGWVSISLADPMKRIAKEIYDFTDEQLWGPSSERNKPDMRYLRGDATHLTPREVLQRLGTEVGRYCYQDTWVDLTLSDAHKILRQTHVYSKSKGAERIYPKYMYSGPPPIPFGVVIPDVRFENEIQAIHKSGGKVVRLKRQTAVNALEIGVKNHASEAEQLAIPDSAVDYVMDVEDGLENFYKQIDQFLKELR